MERVKDSMGKKLGGVVRELEGVKDPMAKSWVEEGMMGGVKDAMGKELEVRGDDWTW